MMSKMMGFGKNLALKGWARFGPKKLTHYQTQWDKFLADKLIYFGLRNKAAYAITLLNLFGFALSYLIYREDNYCRRFAYSVNGSNRLFKYLTCHFANNNPYVFLPSLPVLLIFARKLEILYGTAFLIKLTFLSAFIQILSLRSTRVYDYKLPKALKLPIEQTSKDGKYVMGPHGLIATYASFYVLKKVPRAMFLVAGLAVVDTLLSQSGYWGGYLAGALAFLMF